MTIYLVLCIILFIILLLYILVELHYFIRITISILLAKFCKKRVHIMDETSTNGVCMTTDIDTFLYHMNNARFIRELDFARVDFLQRTGLLSCIRSKGGSIAIGATTIRYRKFVRLFNRYKITSKIVYWDDQSIFMEHRFISPRDNFVNAIILIRTRILKCNVDDLMNELLIKCNDEETTRKFKPELPIEVAKWTEYNDISSMHLRAEC